MADEFIEVESNQTWDLIKQSGIPVLVEFYAPWCEPSKELEPVLKKLIKEDFPVSFFRYNVDRLNYNADRLGVTGIPTIILFLPVEDKRNDPKVFANLKGYLTADQLRKQLEALSAKWKEGNGA